MVDNEKMASVLSEFARTLVTDFPIQGILERLVARIVDLMPITGAGVTLISANLKPHYVAASDDVALRCERLQSELGQGPCLVAYQSGEAVIVPDLLADGDFPEFSRAAADAGLRAVFTFPLRHGSGRLGALDLYRDAPGPLDESAMTAAWTLADVAAAYLSNAQSRDDERAALERFYESSLHDPLTGLPNRVLLHQRLERAAQRAERSHLWAAVMFADLDRFKHVNDTYGHQVGDLLLQAVAQRLAPLVRPGDTLARVSGDEFVFLCEDLLADGDATELAARICAEFTEPFHVGSLTLAVTVSVGIAYAGPGEEISYQLVIDADRAMYQAKSEGGARHHVFDLRAATGARERDFLERDLVTAIEAAGTGGAGSAGAGLESAGLDVVYQPIVRVADGLVTGVEALLRWQHPTLGPIAPLTVIGIAEQNGLIDQIGAWVMERAFRDHRRWLEAHPGSRLDLAVNVSCQQLMGPRFVQTVKDLLASTEMEPADVVLEITETVVIEDPDRALVVLNALRSVGVRLALDDFGTGYSSLSYLRRLPLDVIKIDQSFIADIDHAPASGAIVTAVTDLAHALGMTVIAEGVETSHQREEVTKMRCERAQGYFFARPMTVDAIGAELRTAPPGTLCLPHRRAAARPARGSRPARRSR